MFEEYQHEEPHHTVHFGDNEVDEFDDTKVPTFLKWTYLILPVWGLIWGYLYWDGSAGWLDRGYWQELEAAAKTTFTKQIDETSFKE